MAKGSVEGRAKRRLTVTDQSVMATWDNGKGGETTLYEITAVDENGAPVTEKLRSFAELEEGVLIEYEIERYNHPTHGLSYTLHRPKQNTARRVAALEKQVQTLLDRLSAVEMQVGVEPPAPPQEERGEDDIPF
jgi:hypothetical protein